MEDARRGRGWFLLGSKLQILAGLFHVYAHFESRAAAADTTETLQCQGIMATTTVEFGGLTTTVDNVFRLQSLLMSVMFVTLGIANVIGFLLAADRQRAVRVLGWLNVLAGAAVLALSIWLRTFPTLVGGALLVVLFVAAALRARRRQSW